jgi:hypothetical protein
VGFTVYSLELEIDNYNWSLNCLQCLIIAVCVSFHMRLSFSFIILLEPTLLTLQLARHRGGGGGGGAKKKGAIFYLSNKKLNNKKKILFKVDGGGFLN